MKKNLVAAMLGMAALGIDAMGGKGVTKADLLRLDPPRKNVKVRNTSARSMRHLLNTRVLTAYHGENKRIITGKTSSSISMPINLGRNAEKRALRRGKPRKAWGTLAPHRETK